MQYDEVEYWNTRKQPNSANEQQTNRDIAYIRKHLEGCDYIMDFGPGVGRMFPAYEQIKVVTGYDITEQHQGTLMKEATKYDFVFGMLYADTIRDIPEPDNHFDAVVCVSVLLHQQPRNIERVMKELIRVSKKVIVITWYNPTGAYQKQEHCFMHDYFKLCKDNNWRLYDVERNGERLYFTMEGE